MTIYFDGHTFKYEIEGICKLFFPLMRFTHVFESEGTYHNDPTDCVVTVRSLQADTACLVVLVRLSGECRREETKLPICTPDFERECERVLCELLYRILSAWLGVRPAWGILTGVRPVNIIQRERKSGHPDSETEHLLREKFLVSNEKLSLAMRTADVQGKLLSDMPKRSYSLYVAIPFCVSRCSYCSFVSHAITTKKATDRVEEYLEKLCLELSKTAEVAARLGMKLDTVYIGGGTPTALTAEQLRTVTDAVSHAFPLSDAREYTIEAGRADTITEEKLRVIREAGADRISVNPQTFNDAVLQRIGRKHTAVQAVEAYKLARNMGFSAINMDFIAGLPGDTYDSFCATIDQAIALAPENITVHTLSIKRSADLFSEEGIGEYVKSNDTGKMTAYAQEQLLAAGYASYYLYRQKNTIGNLENVGYSKPGRESLYNVYIMDEIQTILACGAGGATKLVGVEMAGRLPIQRIFNFKYHFEYISRFTEILERKEQVMKFYGVGK